MILETDGIILLGKKRFSTPKCPEEFYKEEDDYNCSDHGGRGERTNLKKGTNLKEVNKVFRKLFMVITLLYK